MRKKLMLMIPIGIGAIVLVSVVGGYSVRFLWNWLLPELFGWPEISFWQALGLLALCRILFGGLGRGGGDRSRKTPEERERFRQGLRKRFGFDPPASESQGDAAVETRPL